MNYKIKSIRLKKQPTKTVDSCAVMKVMGGQVECVTDSILDYSWMYIRFYPDDESLPAVPMVQLNFDKDCPDDIDLNIGPGLSGDMPWSIKELTELAKEW